MRTQRPERRPRERGWSQVDPVPALVRLRPVVLVAAQAVASLGLSPWQGNHKFLVQLHKMAVIVAGRM